MRENVSVVLLSTTTWTLFPYWLSSKAGVSCVSLAFQGPRECAGEWRAQERISWAGVEEGAGANRPLLANMSQDWSQDTAAGELGAKSRGLRAPLSGCLGILHQAQSSEARVAQTLGELNRSKSFGQVSAKDRV